MACAGVAASVVLLGVGGGGPRVGFASVPRDLTVSTSTWGRRSELFELVELARRGQIEIHTQDFDLADGVEVYGLLGAGRIQGRAVIVPR